jgi:hypothetical protein
MSQKQASDKPRKPTKTGREPPILPDLKVLGEKRSDGTKMPSLRQNSSSANAEDINSTIVDSKDEMRPISGWNDKNKTWADEKEEEEAQLETDETTPGSSWMTSTPAPTRKRGKKIANHPDGKKRKNNESWKDAKNVCQIAAKDLDRDLVHEDFLYVQSKILETVIDRYPDQGPLTRVDKSSVREGIIQIALENPEGTAFLKALIPTIPPKAEGESGYTFYGPGEKPFSTYIVTNCDPGTKNDPERFVKALRIYNPEIFANGYLSAAILNSTGSLSVMRLRVGENMVASLAVKNFKIGFGIGPLVLNPTSARVVEGDEAEMETA